MLTFIKKISILNIFTALFLASCDQAGKIVELVKVDLVIQVVSGANQVLSPSQEMQEEIIFAFKDALGNPLVDSEIRFKLIDTTGIQNLGLEDIKNALKSDVNGLFLNDGGEIARTTVESPGEELGILMAEAVRTDSRGLARNRVTAPKRFNRRITVVAISGKENDPFFNLSYANFSTSRFGNSESLSVTSTNLLAEHSGKPFDFTVTVLREGKVVDFGESQDYPIRIKTYPDDNQISEIPTEDLTCNFQAGHCTVPGGPFVVYGSGDLRFTVEMVGENLAIFEDKIKITQASADQLALTTAAISEESVDECEDLKIKNEPDNPCLIFVADRNNITLRSFIADNVGRIINGEVVSWEISGPLSPEGDIISFTQKPEVELNLFRSGKGFVKLTHEKLGFEKSYSYEVLPGRPAYYQVTSTNGGSESSVSNFGAVLTLFDRKDNPATSYNGPLDLEFTLSGANSSPDPVLKAPVKSFAESVEFLSGVGRSSASFLAPNGADTIQIEVSGSLGMARSGDISMNPGPVVSASFRTRADGQSEIIPDPVTMQPDSSRLFYLAGTDKYGNFSAPVPADWKTRDFESGQLILSKEGDGSYVNASARFGGEGVLVATPIDKALAAQSIGISIASGLPVSLELDTSGGRTETAGEPFGVRIIARDLRGKVSTEFSDSLPLSFNHSPVENSWLGKVSTLPFGIINCAFSKGVCNLPNPTGMAGFVINNSQDEVVLSVKDNSGKISSGASSGESNAFSIKVQPGKAHEVVFADQAGGPSSGATVLNLSKVHLAVGDSLVLNPASVDKGGNYLGARKVSWSSPLSKISDGFALSGVDSEVLTYSPKHIVTDAEGGRIFASVSEAPTPISFQVLVRSGKPEKIAFHIPNSANLAPGECRTPEAILQDKEGNPITDIDEKIEIGIGIGSSTAPASSPHTIVRYGTYEGINASRSLAHRFKDGFFLPPSQLANQSLRHAQLGRISFCQSPSSCSGTYYETDVFQSQEFPYPPVSWLHSGATLTTIGNDGKIELPSVCIARDKLTPSLYVHIPEVEVNWGDDYGGVITYPELFQKLDFSLQPGTEQFLSFHEESTSSPGTAGKRYCADSMLESNRDERFPNENEYLRCFGRYYNGPTADDNKVFTVFANITDGGGNYIRPATGTWALYPITDRTTVLTNTPEKFSFTTTDAWVEYNLHFVDSSSGINDRMRFAILPGLPAKIEAVKAGHSNDEAPAGFDLFFELRDQFGNSYRSLPPPTLITPIEVCRSRYGAERNMVISSDAQPSPKGTSPHWPANLLMRGPCEAQGMMATLTGAFYHPKAASSKISITIPDFPDPGKTKILDISRQVGSEEEVGVFLTNNFSGTKVPANWSISSDDEVGIYILGRDRELNPGPARNATVSVTGALAADPGQYDYNKVDGRLGISPSSPGASTITVSYTGGFPDEVISLTVTEGTLHNFQFSVDGNSSNISMAAGIPASVVITAHDRDNNLLTDFHGPKLLQIASNIVPNSEGQRFSGFVNGSYTFVGGRLSVPISLTPLAATDSAHITVGHTDGSHAVSSAFTFSVSPGGFHHYGVIPSTSYTPTRDLRNSFSATVYLRDEWGNNISSGPNDPISLSLIRQDGTAAPGGLAGTTTGINLSTGLATVTDLKYDGVGTFKIKATGAAEAVERLSNSVLTEIIMSPNLDVIKELRLEVQGNTTNLRAGQPFNVKVSAIDKHGSIVAADSDLNTLTLDWSGLSTAQNGTAPTYAPSGGFVGGEQIFTITPVTTETIAPGRLSLAAKNGGSLLFSGLSTVSLDIKPGSVGEYVITPSKTALTADNQPSGLFDINIKCLDQYQNPCAGESNLGLEALWVSGPAALVGPVQGLPGSRLDLSAGELNLKGLHYPIGHQMKLTLSGTSATIVAPDMTFTPTEGTISSYRVEIDPSTVGDNRASATVSALDTAGNLINHPTVDSVLSSYDFCWSGFLNSPPPTSKAPVADNRTPFTSGRGVFTHSLYSAGTIPMGAVVVKDNFGGSCSSGRRGSNSAAAVISPGLIAGYAVDNFSQFNQMAGTAFYLDIAAKDSWGNTIASHPDEALSFAWKGATPSLRQGHTAESDTAGVKNFVNGVWRSATAFKLFNTGDPNPKLQITGTSSGISSEISNFNLRAHSQVDALVITSQNVNYTWGSGAFDSHEMTTDDSLTLYALAYDAWGNAIGTTEVDWSSENADLTSALSSTSSASSTLFAPTLPATGTIVATHGASGATDSTGTVTIAPGAISQFEVQPQANSPVTAGQTFSVIVTAQDSRGNTVTSFSGEKAGTFTWNNAGNSPNGASPTVSLPACHFTAGVCSTGAEFSLFRHGDSATLSYSTEGKSGTSLIPLSVIHGGLTSLEVQPVGGGYTVTAGTAFSFQITATDAYGNPATGSPALDLNYSWENTTATVSAYGAGHALSPAGEPAGPKNFASDGSYTTSPSFILYNAYDDDSSAKPRLKVSSSSPMISGYSGGFTINPLASVHYVRIHNSTDLPATGGISTELGDTSITGDESLTVRLYGFDHYGNEKGLQAGNWSANGNHGGGLVGGLTGTNSITLPGSAGIGSGTITAQLSSDSLIQDSTGTIEITAGAESSYVLAFTTASPVGAGQGIGATVTAMDQHGQVVTTLNATRHHTDAFQWIGAGHAPDGTAPGTPTACHFINGICTISEASSSLTLFNASDAGVHLKYTYGGKSGQTTSGALSVTYNSQVNNFLVVPDSNTVGAGSGFDVRITARDAWENIIAKTQDIDLSYTWKNSSATGAGSALPLAPAPATASFINGVYTSSGAPFTLYNTYDVNPILEVKKTASFVNGNSPPFTVTAATTVGAIAVVKDNGGGNYVEVGSHNMDAAENFTVFAEGRDPWGNPNGLQLADWSATGDHSGRLSTSSNASGTSLSGSVGVGVIEAKLSSNNSISDQTDTISVSPGAFSLSGDSATPHFESRTGQPTFTWGASAGRPVFDLKVVSAPGCSGGGSTLFSVSGLASATPDGSENSYTMAGTDRLPDGGPYYLCVTARGINGSGDASQNNNPHPDFYVESTILHLLTRSQSGAGTHHLDYFSNNFRDLSDSDLEAVEARDNSRTWYTDRISLGLDSSNIPHISFARFNGTAYSLVYGYRSNSTFTTQITDLFTGSGAYKAPGPGEQIGALSSLTIDRNNSDTVYIAHKRHRVSAIPSDVLSIAVDTGGGSSLSTVEAMNRLNTFDSDLDVFDLSIALDSSGNRHVAWIVKDYHDSGQYRLMYQKAGDASQEITSGLCNDILKVDLAIDGADQAHIAYLCQNKFQTPSCALSYKRQISGAWNDSTEKFVHTVIPSSLSCDYSSIAEGNDTYKPSLITDTNNCPHVSFTYASGSDHKIVGYARQPYSGQCGSFAPPENPGSSRGSHTRIALDEFGYVYIGAISSSTAAPAFILSNNPSPSGGWSVSGADADSSLGGLVTGISELKANGVRGRDNFTAAP